MKQGAAMEMNFDWRAAWTELAPTAEPEPVIEQCDAEVTEAELIYKIQKRNLRFVTDEND